MFSKLKQTEQLKGATHMTKLDPSEISNHMTQTPPFTPYEGENHQHEMVICEVCNSLIFENNVYAHISGLPTCSDKCFQNLLDTVDAECNKEL